MDKEIVKQDEKDIDIKPLIVKSEQSKFLTKLAMAGEDIFELPATFVLMSDENGIPMPDWLVGSMKTMKENRWEFTEERIKRDRALVQEINDIYEANPEKYTTTDKLGHMGLATISNPLNALQIMAKVNPVADLGMDMADVYYDEQIRSEDPEYMKAFGTYGGMRLAFGVGSQIVGKGVEAIKESVPYNTIAETISPYIPHMKNTIAESKIALENLNPNSKNAMVMDIRGSLDTQFSKVTPQDVSMEFQGNNLETINIQNLNLNHTGRNVFIDNEITDYIDEGQGRVLASVELTRQSLISNFNNTIKQLEDENVELKAQVNRMHKDASKLTNEEDIANVMFGASNIERDIDINNSKINYYKDKVFKLNTKQPDGVLDGIKQSDELIKEEIMKSTTPLETQVNNIKRGVVFNTFDWTDVAKLYTGVNIDKLQNTSKLYTNINNVNGELRIKSPISRYGRLAEQYMPIVREVSTSYRTKLKTKKPSSKLADLLPSSINQNIYEIGNTFLDPYKAQQTRLYNFYVSNMYANGKKVSPQTYLQSVNNIDKHHIANYILGDKYGDKFIDNAYKDYKIIGKLESGYSFKDLDSSYLDTEAELTGMRLFRDKFGSEMEFDFNNAKDIEKYVNVLKAITNDKDKPVQDIREMKIFTRNIAMNDSNLDIYNGLVKSIDNEVLSGKDIDEVIDTVAKDVKIGYDVLRYLYDEKDIIKKYYTENNVIDNKYYLLMRKDRVIAFGEKFYFNSPDSAGFRYSKLDDIKVLDNMKDDFQKEIVDGLYKTGILQKPVELSYEEAFARFMLEFKRTRSSARFTGSKRSLGSLIGDEIGFTNKEAIDTFITMNDGEFLKDNIELINNFLIGSTKKQALWIEYGTTSPFRVVSEIKFGIKDRIGKIPEIQDKAGTNVGENVAINTINQILDEGIRTELGIRTRTQKAMGESIVDVGIDLYRVIKRTGGGYDELLANPALVAGLQSRYASKKNIISGIDKTAKRFMDSSEDIASRFFGQSKNYDLGNIGDINFKYNSEFLNPSFMDSVKDFDASGIIDKAKAVGYAGDTLSNNVMLNMSKSVVTEQLSNMPSKFDDVPVDLKGILIRNGVTEENYLGFKNLSEQLYKEQGGIYNLSALYEMADKDRNVRRFLDIYNNYINESSNMFKDTKYWTKGGLLYKTQNVNRGFMRAMGTNYGARMLLRRNSDGILVHNFKNLKDVKLKDVGKGVADLGWQTISYGLNGAINNATRIALTSGVVGGGSFIVGWEAFKNQLGISSSNDTGENVINTVKNVALANNPINSLVMGASDVAGMYTKTAGNLYKLALDDTFGETGVDKLKLEKFGKALSPMKPSYWNMFMGAGYNLAKLSGQELSNEGYIFKTSFMVKPEEAQRIQLALNNYYSDNGIDTQVTEEEVTDMIKTQAMLENKEDREAIIVKGNNIATKETKIQEANIGVMINNPVGYNNMNNKELKRAIDKALIDAKVKDSHKAYIQSVIYRAYVSAENTNDMIESIKDKLNLDLTNYIKNVDVDYISNNKELTRYCIYKYIKGEYYLFDDELEGKKEIPQEYNNEIDRIMNNKIMKKNILEIYR